MLIFTTSRFFLESPVIVITHPKRLQRGHTRERWVDPSRKKQRRAAPFRGATKNAEHVPDGQRTISQTRPKEKIYKIFDLPGL